MALEKIAKQGAHLQGGEIGAEAPMGSAAEWHERKAVPVPRLFR